MAEGDIIKDADLPGLGDPEDLPGGAVTVGDAIPEMPPGSDMNDVATADDNIASAGGGLTADDTAQPTSTADTTGDQATGLTGLRGG
jgi:hypothetical protein